MHYMYIMKLYKPMDTVRGSERILAGSDRTVCPFIMQQRLLALGPFSEQYDPFKNITLNLVSVRTALPLAVILVKQVHGLVYSVSPPKLFGHPWGSQCCHILTDPIYCD